MKKYSEYMNGKGAWNSVTSDARRKDTIMKSINGLGKKELPFYNLNLKHGISFNYPFTFTSPLLRALAIRKHQASFRCLLQRELGDRVPHWSYWAQRQPQIPPPAAKSWYWLQLLWLHSLAAVCSRCSQISSFWRRPPPCVLHLPLRKGGVVIPAAWG